MKIKSKVISKSSDKKWYLMGITEESSWAGDTILGEFNSEAEVHDKEADYETSSRVLETYVTNNPAKYNGESVDSGFDEDV